VGLEVALEGGLKRMPDPSREVNVGRRDADLTVCVCDGHYPRQGVLSILCTLGIAHEADDFVPMLDKKASAQIYLARRKFVFDTVACWARLPICLFRYVRCPLPPALPKESPAFWAHGGFVQLLSRFVGIVAMRCNMM
jgi:hypothetical protein